MSQTGQIISNPGSPWALTAGVPAHIDLRDGDAKQSKEGRGEQVGQHPMGRLETRRHGVARTAPATQPKENQRRAEWMGTRDQR